jgi:hypothetical protein
LTAPFVKRGLFSFQQGAGLIEAGKSLHGGFFIKLVVFVSGIEMEPFMAVITNRTNNLVHLYQ